MGAEELRILVQSKNGMEGEVTKLNFTSFCKEHAKKLGKPVAIAVETESDHHLLSSSKLLKRLPQGIYTGSLVQKIPLSGTEHELWKCI
jgi:hypothetical protein